MSNVSSVGPSSERNISFSLTKLQFLSDEGPTLETLDYTIRIGSTPISICISTLPTQQTAFIY